MTLKMTTSKIYFFMFILKKDGQLFTSHSITSSNRMDAYSKCLFLRGFQTHNKEDFMRKIAIKMPMKVTELEEIQTVINLHTKSVYSHQVSRHIIKKFLREKSPLIYHWLYQQKWLSLELPQLLSLRKLSGNYADITMAFIS